MQRVIAAFSAVLVLGLGAMETAQAAEGKLKGYMFGDYYYIVSGMDEKQNAFQFRRIYFTYDQKWDDRFSGRLRTEANDAGFGEGGKMVPAVKDAYLKYKRGNHAISAGIVGTPTWNGSEKAWGYRSVEKTIMDLNKIGSSRDEGILLKSNLDGDGRFGLQVMVANGNSNKSEVDNHKKYYGLLSFAPSDGVVATAYADLQTRPGDRDKNTLGLFVGKQGKDLHGGIEAYLQTTGAGSGGDDVTGQGVSVFAAKRVGEKTKVFARADVVDPNTDVDDDGHNVLIVGIDTEPTKGIHIMPNIWIKSYQASGVDATVMPRITAFFKFPEFKFEQGE